MKGEFRSPGSRILKKRLVVFHNCLLERSLKPFASANRSAFAVKTLAQKARLSLEGPSTLVG
eukprot:3603856-Amphidinium_carterae.1